MAGEPPGADSHIFPVGFCLCNKGNTVDKITLNPCENGSRYAENPCDSSGNPFGDEAASWDFSLFKNFKNFKNFKFTERWGAQFRFEVFNLLNHPIVGNPYGAAAGANLGSDPSAASTFGCGCSTPDVGNGNALFGSGSARVMQLGLKLSF